MRKDEWRRQREQYLIDFLNVMISHPGKTIEISKDGIEALETTEPECIIVGEINETMQRT